MKVKIWKSESENIECHQNGRKKGNGEISPEVLPTLPWTQHHQPDIRVPPTENNSRSGNLWFSFNVFSIVFLSQHFQWCSSLPTERNRDQEIWNLFQYTIFFLHGYLKSYQFYPFQPGPLKRSSFDRGIGKYFSLLTFYIIVSSY